MLYSQKKHIAILQTHLKKQFDHWIETNRNIFSIHIFHCSKGESHQEMNSI